MDSNCVGVLGQDPSQFVVGIKRCGTAYPVGTGFVIAMDGRILTGRHVVEAAGVNPRTRTRIPGRFETMFGFAFRRPSDTEARVCVCFHQTKPPIEKDAVVEAIFPEHDDDVVLLRLTDSTTPLGPEQIASLGSVYPAEQRRFRTWGYRTHGDYQGLHGHGTILGFAGRRTRRKLLGEAVQLESDNIYDGMSGAPVVDLTHNLVVGLIEKMSIPRSVAKIGLFSRVYRDRMMNFGVDAGILANPPFNLQLRLQAMPLRCGPQPRPWPPTPDGLPGESRNLTSHMPGFLHEWVGREAELQTIILAWEQNQAAHPKAMTLATMETAKDAQTSTSGSAMGAVHSTQKTAEAATQQATHRTMSSSG